MQEPILREFKTAKRIANQVYYKNTILRYIYAHKKATKKELADLLDISLPALSQFVDSLAKDNTLICHKNTSSSWGRSAGYYTINPDKSLIIGCLISPDKIELCLFNTSGEILNQYHKIYRFIASPDNLIKHMITAIHKLMESYDATKLQAISVGCHGVIDVDKGESVFMPHKATWKSFSIRYRLASRFHVPVFVDNDCNIIALAEKWLGSAKAYKDFFIINLDYGIGAGIIINNYIYHGTSLFSGQIGHTPVTEYGPKCQCGNYGCLETVASEPALLKQLKMRLTKGYISDYFNDFDIHNITNDDFYKAIHQHDPVALRVIEDAAISISFSIRNMIHIIAPEAIILTGHLTKAGDYLLKPIQNAIISPFDIHTGTTIKLAKLKKEEYIKGSFYLWVEHTLKTRR